MSTNFNFNETTFLKLYKSTLSAFPNTNFRQHVIDVIEVKDLKFIPYIGLNTLFIKSITENTEKHTKYKTLALIKDINYKDFKKSTKIFDEYGKQHNFEKPKIKVNDVLIRCSCDDFMWRFHQYNSKDKSLYGRKKENYKSKGLFEANPSKSPGMCKHLMKLFENLIKKKIIEAT